MPDERVGCQTLAGVFIPSASCGRRWLYSWRKSSSQRWRQRRLGQAALPPADCMFHHPLTSARRHHELHPLLRNLHRPPRHPACLLAKEGAILHPNATRKGKSVRHVQRQSVKDVMQLNS